MNRLESIADFNDWRNQLKMAAVPDMPTILLCGGTGCTAFGAQEVYQALQDSLERLGLGEKVQLKKTGCHGFCEKGPVVVIVASTSEST